MKYQIIEKHGSRIFAETENERLVGGLLKKWRQIERVPVAVNKTPSVDWRAREEREIKSGKYIRPTWGNSRSLSPGYSPLLSKKHPGMVLFTRSEEDGEANRKTQMRLRAFLKRYSLIHDEDEIRRVVMFTTLDVWPPKLKFARTAKQISWVYEHGPNTCMSGTRARQGPQGRKRHPAEAYAAGDLAVAYLLGNHNKKVSARAVCWPQKRIHGFAYGDMRNYLIEKLQALKFSLGPLNGARLRKISAGPRTFLCPCIDSPHGRGCVTKSMTNTNYLVIARAGRMTSTEGTVNLNDVPYSSELIGS